MTYKLNTLDKPDHHSLEVDGKFRAIVKTWKDGRSNMYRVFLGRNNWADVKGKPAFEKFIKARW